MKRNWLVDAYRIFLVLWIAIFHYTYSYNTASPDIHIAYPIIFNHGFIGVPIFFMMSGFYMERIMVGSGGFKKYINYCAKRFIRLWVPYVISCIVIYIMLNISPFFKQTIDFELFLLNIVTFVHPGMEYVDGSHWFVGMLMVMQVVLGVSLLIKDAGRRSTILCLSILIGIIHWTAYLFNVSIVTPHTSSLFFMLLGIQLAKIILHRDIIFAIPLVICLSYIIVYYPYLYILNILLFVLIADGRLARCIYNDRNGELNILGYLGGISFCWYLVHNRIGASLQYNFVPHSNTSELWLMLPVIGTLTIAIFVHITAEYLKKKTNVNYESLLSWLSEKRII